MGQLFLDLGVLNGLVLLAERERDRVQHEVLYLLDPVHANKRALPVESQRPSLLLSRFARQFANQGVLGASLEWYFAGLSRQIRLSLVHFVEVNRLFTQVEGQLGETGFLLEVRVEDLGVNLDRVELILDIVALQRSLVALKLDVHAGFNVQAGLCLVREIRWNDDNHRGHADLCGAFEGFTDDFEYLDELILLHAAVLRASKVARLVNRMEVEFLC